MVVSLFVAALSLPLIGMIFDLDNTPPNCKPASRPEFAMSLREIVRYPVEFKRYFQDNFGFRSALITLHGKLKYYGLGMSSNQKVLIGENGWLFYRPILDNYLRVYPFSDEELDIWVTLLRNRDEFCRERGCAYLFTVSPNKHMIYPQQFPARYHPAGNPGRLDQLIGRLERDLPGYPMVDVRGILEKNREKERIYFITDTHWTELGALYAYQEIAEELRRSHPQVEIQGIHPIRTQSRSGTGGDLARILGLMHELPEEVASPVDWTARTVTREDGSPLNLPDRNIHETEKIVTRCDEGEIGVAVIFHDSYAISMIEPLASHFRRAVFVWSHEFLPDLVAEESPDVVIQQIVDRKLSDWTPDLAELESQ